MKQFTEAQAEQKRLQAIEFLQRVGGDSSKFEDMDATEYAEHRGAQLLNPTTRRITMTKSELDALVDEIADGLEECLDPSLTRDQVIEKVQELSDLATGETPEENDEDED